MSAKSSEQKAIEKQMKENQRMERDNARRERESAPGLVMLQST